MKRGLNTINVYQQNSLFSETIPLNVTQTSTSQVFALTTSINAYDCLAVNMGPGLVFFTSGNSKNGAVVATVPGTTGTVNATPIPSGAVYTFQKQSDNATADTMAAICSGTATATIYFTAIQGS
jgi:hypothetical protein